MKITAHSKNPNYFVVNEPTSQAIVEAERLSKRNFAKIQADGRLIVHQSSREQFEFFVKQSHMAAKNDLAGAINEQTSELLDQVWYA
jgi:hypothetical protein